LLWINRLNQFVDNPIGLSEAVLSEIPGQFMSYLESKGLAHLRGRANPWMEIRLRKKVFSFFLFFPNVNHYFPTFYFIFLFADFLYNRFLIGNLVLLLFFKTSSSNYLHCILKDWAFRNFDCLIYQFHRLNFWICRLHTFSGSCIFFELKMDDNFLIFKTMN
jgi:hypothetical protein